MLSILIDDPTLLMSFAALLGVGVPMGLMVWWHHFKDPEVQFRIRSKKRRQRHKAQKQDLNRDSQLLG